MSEPYMRIFPQSVRYWQDRERTIPAGIGDPVAVVEFADMGTLAAPTDSSRPLRVKPDALEFDGVDDVMEGKP